VLWLLVIGVLYGILMLLSAPVVEWIGKGPEIARNIQQKLHLLDGPLAALQDLRNAIFPAAKGDNGVNVNFLSMLRPALGFVTPALGELVVFFGALFFFLLGRTELRRVLVVFFDEREDRLRMLRILNDVEHNLTSYLSVVALINMAVGICAGVVAFAVGLPNPLAWAVLGFLLNFIPYLGALIMQIVLFIVGLVTFPTLGHAIVAPLLYLGFTTLEGHFITPTIMGRRLTLNPLTVFLALVFWTWLWGPIGAFLAVPLVIIALVAIHHLFPKEDAALPD
jgi:predicted PurR-regulated permease PerM